MRLAESKRKRSSMRVTPSRSASRTRASVVGSAGSGSPEASAKPSVNSSEVGASTAVTRHQPREVSPPGPVMK